MIVAIHQPNFLPHLGYFAKMESADRFVFLDSAQFPTEGWVHRNKLLNGNEASWITVPVMKSGRGVQAIREIDVRQTTPWKRKLIKRIEQEYRRAPHVERVLETFKSLLDKNHQSLCQMNIELVDWIRDELKIQTECSIASQLDEKNASGASQDPTQRLIQLVKAVAGTSYLSGPSGRKYLDEKSFSDNNLSLSYHSYSPPEYEQGRRSFVAGLSTLDALLWLGPDETRKLIAP